MCQCCLLYTSIGIRAVVSLWTIPLVQMIEIGSTLGGDVNLGQETDVYKRQVPVSAKLIKDVLIYFIVAMALMPLANRELSILACLLPPINPSLGR